MSDLLSIILFIVHWYSMNLSKLSCRGNECYVNLNMMEHCIFFLVALQYLSTNVCIQFIIFILCVCTTISWWWASKCGVTMWQLMWNFCLFVFCTLIYVHISLLGMHCKAKLSVYLRCIFDIFPFCVILIQFCRIFPNCEKGKCLQFLINL